MDIFDNIRKLASDAVDLTLQKMKAERIGAEAARRGLFEGYLRTVPNDTLANMLRERKALCASLTDDELSRAFRKRDLRDEASYKGGWDNNSAKEAEGRADEAARVRALAAEIIERAEKL